MSKKSELYEQYEGIIGQLQNCPNTIIMTNQGSTKGQLYTIHKATQEQSDKSLCGNVLFIGTATETSKYLQGFRDLIIEVLPNRLNGLTK